MHKSNAEQAAVNFFLWLSWHPEDYQGAAEFASDSLDTEEDLDELIQVFENEVEN